tara:strand:+ start:468 stop:674 length:207 start_codon:yes stop_codon:yes gene_type:complete
MKNKYKAQDFITKISRHNSKIQACLDEFKVTQNMNLIIMALTEVQGQARTNEYLENLIDIEENPPFSA